MKQTKTLKTKAKKRVAVKKVAAKKSTGKKSTGKKTLAAHKASTAKALLAAGPCRMIFIDVENTSSEERLASVLDHLKIDHKVQRTEIAAIGNWKAVGSRSGRLLARAGAHLMHSAPATGVRDWSDLWIAVAAGRWIENANPGDRIDIVSDDHAFDAVADAAAACGLEFHRISHRSLLGVPDEPPRTEVAKPKRRRRGGRRYKPAGEASPAATTPAPAHAPAHPPAPHAHAASSSAKAAAHDGDGGAAATAENIREAIHRLTGGNSDRWVNLDLVGNALRAQGFTRPPGSPRLVTRVRLLQDVEVSPTGMARIKPTAALAAGDGKPEVAAESPKPAAKPKRAPRKRTAPAA